ncbi:MAG: hypothetical protein KatS3mg101_0076 [Patescibacteria group bacterium]|nr:MAG: hypothetical protein KatS3mg101_0076 [Patescibacteria group bacterium]
MNNKKIGTITHYYDRLGVGIIKLSDDIKVGDKIRIIGSTTDFEQNVLELQFNHQNIEEGKGGQEVGIKVNEKVREGDEVFLV